MNHKNCSRDAYEICEPWFDHVCYITSHVPTFLSQYNGGPGSITSRRKRFLLHSGINPTFYSLVIKIEIDETQDHLKPTLLKSKIIKTQYLGYQELNNQKRRLTKQWLMKSEINETQVYATQDSWRRWLRKLEITIIKINENIIKLKVYQNLK
jgi:hypothetical protein